MNYELKFKKTFVKGNLGKLLQIQILTKIILIFEHKIAIK